jgi:lysophospholipase L1-like esterase
MKTMTEHGPSQACATRRRIWLLLGAGLLLLVAAGTYRYLYFARSIGTGPAGPAVDRTAFTRAWGTRPVWMVGLGDSVTAGFGARKGYGYFDRLVSNPPDESPDMKDLCLRAVFHRLTVTNLAVSGSISHELAEMQLSALPRAEPDTIGWVVITTGGNDLIHNYGRTPPREQAMFGATLEQAMPWIERFGQRLETIISGINDRFPGGCHIFLANIYDPTDGVGDIKRAGLPPWPDGLKILRAYNEMINRCALERANVHIIDMHEAFLGHGIHCAEFWFKHYHPRDAHYWYYYNLEDPNERGYDAIRRLFLNEMVKVSASLP